MITLTGLTDDQMDMLDIMWSLDTEEDYFNWYDCLDKEQQQMAELLQRLVIMESIDNDMAAMKKFPDAMKVIDSIKK